MNNITIKTLAPIRLPIIKKLYKLHYPSTKIKAGEAIYIAEDASSIVGIVRFRNIDKWRLLTGMLVTPSHRNKGIASAMLEYCVQNVLDTDVYCFSYDHLTDLYAAHSFQIISAEQLPTSLERLYLRYTQTGKSLTIMQFQR